MTITKKDILTTSSAERQIGIFYLGQEGFLFRKKGFNVVVDPYLSDYVDQNCCDLVKWERLYAPPISPEELDFVDLVVCTHSHFDHADPWTLSKIAKVNKKANFIVPSPEVSLISSYGVEKDRIIGAKADTPINLGEITVTPVPSAHEVFHKDDNGDFKELGYIFDFNNARFFHAGDMCVYDGLKERLRNIDIAFLPINGRDYYRNKNDIIGNFNSDEAVLLAKEISAEILVPMHHDLYEVNKESPSNFVNAIERFDRLRKYHIFSPGEKYIFEK
ncbi:MAG: MBL fold metallo-hydrolase [Clostridia bacterium]|nr:MBL fold metallo-hydrolase [Clostridia bacterium]